MLGLQLKLQLSRKYSAFTLVELLVVMTIMVILSAMSISSFGGLRSSVILNEGATNIQQVLRNSQRSAMLLKRDIGERWIYGIGVDFTTIEDDGKYRVFKWCSPFQIYGSPSGFLPSFYATSKFPNYNPDELLSQQNGVLPVAISSDVWFDDCLGSTSPVSEGTFTEIKSEITTIVEQPTVVEIPTISGGGKVGYVVFESISGRTFLYNESGALLNYDADGDAVEFPDNFSVLVSTNDGSRSLNISVSNVSGKIALERITEED
jgi:prepilin-type N-terminal cleavage/methylation domain-containing protein